MLPLEQIWNPYVFDERWDKYFFGMAEYVSHQSKDPSTKCGAVIVRPDKTVASMGFNGFPKKMSDNPVYYQDRDLKYSRIIHAEMNALLHSKESLHGYTIFLHPFLPCDRCCVHIIQSGITSVAAPIMAEDHPERWKEAAKRTEIYLREAGVRIVCGVH